MTACAFPRCTTPPSTTNRAQQPTCREHVAVVVDASFVGDRHVEAVES